MKAYNSPIIFILCLLLNACTSSNRSDEKLPLITYCDLVAAPSQHDEEVVRVRAHHIVGFEWSYLADGKCSDTSPVTNQTWIIIPDDAWCDGAPQTNTSLPQEYNRSVALEREVIIVGTFHSTRGGPIGQFSIELTCLEKATRWRIIR